MGVEIEKAGRGGSESPYHPWSSNSTWPCPMGKTLRGQGRKGNAAFSPLHVHMDRLAQAGHTEVSSPSSYLEMLQCYPRDENVANGSSSTKRNWPGINTNLN